MSRPKTIRKIDAPPKFKGYKPYGYYAEESEPVELLYEEFEALRLCDYKLFTQLEAAGLMKISRPTLTRIYESARRKVATAFSEARVIKVKGGKVYFNKKWYECNNCFCHFTNPEKNKIIKKCPLCESDNISNIKEKL